MTTKEITFFKRKYYLSKFQILNVNETSFKINFAISFINDICGFLCLELGRHVIDKRK